MSAVRRAIVLLSGGLDSTTTLAIAKEQGFSIYALTFDYGQRQKIEVDAARRIASLFNVDDHVVLDIDLRAFGGSALTDDIPVPKDRKEAEIGSGIPITYVPARNTIFLSLALAWAEVLDAADIFIGVNAVDFSGYPDCRPEYIEAYQAMARLATRAGLESSSDNVLTIHTPLLEKSKGEIIREGIRLGVDYSQTTSCYDPSPSGTACGRCDACLLRIRGFEEAGGIDPTLYQDRIGT